MCINKKTFECEISDSFITTEYDTDSKFFWITRYFIDITNKESNLFGMLLSQMIIYMKKKHMTVITMTISVEEWNIINKNNNWTLLKSIDTEGLVEIKCSIDNVFDCLLDGFFGETKENN